MLQIGNLLKSRQRVFQVGMPWIRSLSSESAEQLESNYVVPTYGTAGVRGKKGLVFTHGKGAHLFDSTGKEYIDLNAGIAVNILGHADQGLIDAATDQLSKVAHVSNLYHTQPYLDLAEKLVKNSPGMGKVFFCNSGTEAMEGAIKFARLFQNSKGQSKTRNRFVAFKQSFHGRSLGALSLTYKPAIRVPFAPMLIQNVDHVEYNNLAALEAAIGPDCIALVMEPVQGEGGIRAASRELVNLARELCDKHGVALIFDEVQIGLGRQGNGRLWSYEEYGVVPDLLTMAKPLAGGLPIGGVMLKKEFFDAVPTNMWLGAHGSTFAGNPLVTRVANVVVDRVMEPGFLECVKETGKYMISRLELMKTRLPEQIVEVRRPLGDAALFAGIQLPTASAGKVVSYCLDNNVVAVGAGDYGDVIRLCPPLIISREDIDKAMDVLEEGIRREVALPKKETQEKPAAFALKMSDQSLASTSPQDYESKLEAHGHTVLPEGFSVGDASLKFFPVELPRTEKSKPAKMNITLIVPEKPTNKYAAMFTQNTFPGAPVRVGRELVAAQKPICAVVVNNKISNVHPRGGGVTASREVCAGVAKALGSDADVFPSSTGVIGWELPVKEMVECIPSAVERIQSASILPAARGIMTTDTFPKARSCVIEDPVTGTVLGRVTGIAKGAGMIEPNMATMLVYIVTDVDAEPALLDKVLRRAVAADGSFNRISVDSDQSTSDTIMLLSSSKRPKLPASIEEEALFGALSKVCTGLAQDVVRNGEGTQHVMKVTVTGAPNEALAHGTAKAIVNSPLVKTAIAGNDPNVGRIIGAIGSYVGKHFPAWADLVASECKIEVGGKTVFENGCFTLDPEKESYLQSYLKDTEITHGGYPVHYNTVDIVVSLRKNVKGSSTTVFGADLTHTYVDVNAGYRT